MYACAVAATMPKYVVSHYTMIVKIVYAMNVRFCTLVQWQQRYLGL
jgi:hypothetical protein